MTAYILTVLSLAGIFAILAISYDLLFGFAGLFSIAHGAFFGIGAYAGALAMLRFGVPFAAAVAIGAVLTAAIASIVSVPASRLEGDYLIVGSLAFAVIAHDLMLNLPSVTRGPMGLPGIPAPSIFGLSFDSPLGQLAIIYGMLALAGLVGWRIGKSPYGRVLRALKDDPLAVEAAGKSVFRYKVEVMTVGSALAGAAGVIYASYVNFIDPESFVLRISFLILLSAVIGGAGTLIGPCIGALFLWAIPELLRFSGIPSTSLGALNEIIYGALLLLVVFLRPEGIIGKSRRRSPPAALEARG